MKNNPSITPLQERVLEAVNRRPLKVDMIAYECATSIAMASRARNELRRLGLVHWLNYEDATTITEAGRTALSNQGGSDRG